MGHTCSASQDNKSTKSISFVGKNNTFRYSNLIKYNCRQCTIWHWHGYSIVQLISPTSLTKDCILKMIIEQCSSCIFSVTHDTCQRLLPLLIVTLWQHWFHKIICIHHRICTTFKGYLSLNFTPLPIGQRHPL